MYLYNVRHQCACMCIHALGSIGSNLDSMLPFFRFVFHVILDCSLVLRNCSKANTSDDAIHFRIRKGQKYQFHSLSTMDKLI